MNPRGKILLVEDNVDDVELILAALAKNNLANEVVVARHGGEARSRRGNGAGRSRNGDGAGRVGRPRAGLRAAAHLRPLARLILTSSLEEADLARSYELGANSYVVKPADFQQFADVIRQLGMFWAVVNEPPQRDAKR